MSNIYVCPICKVEVKSTESYFPFCCKRCQTIDLGRWADGSYSIAGEPIPDYDDENISIH